MFYSFHFYCIYHLINMKSSLTLLCLVVWVNVDASSAQTEPKDFCGPPPHLMNGDTMGHNRERYRNGESVHYECQKYYILDPPSAYKTCRDGIWTGLITCLKIEGACINPTVMNGFIVQSNERNVDPRNSKIYYSCNVGFKPSTGGWWGEATCTEGTWSGILQCIAQGVICDPPPKVENAIVKIPYQNKYIEGFEVNYECRKSFEIEGLKKLTCENGSWTTSPPTCKQYCGKPEGTGKKILILDQVQKRYENGNQIDYICISPYKGPGGKATCQNREWLMPVECKASCPDPPSIENGDFIKEKRDEGITEVYYQCSRRYTLSFTGSIRCQNGIWPSPPKCLRPCEISTFDAEYNLKNLPKKYYTAHGEKKTLQCKEGYYHKYKILGWNIVEIEVKCDDGEMQYGEHKPICSHLDS